MREGNASWDYGTLRKSADGRTLAEGERRPAGTAGRMATGDLMAELASGTSLEGYFQRHAMLDQTLAEFLQAQLHARGLHRPKVLKDAQVDQTFGWYVFKGQRGIGRDNLLKICFAMRFDARHANHALQLAGASCLHPRNRRDAVIIYCLEHAHTLQQANDTLYAFGEECL